MKLSYKSNTIKNWENAVNTMLKGSCDSINMSLKQKTCCQKPTNSIKRPKEVKKNYHNTLKQNPDTLKFTSKYKQRLPHPNTFIIFISKGTIQNFPSHRYWRLTKDVWFFWISNPFLFLKKQSAKLSSRDSLKCLSFYNTVRKW